MEAAVVDEVLARVPAQARSRDKVSRALTAAQRLLEREGVAALSITRVAAEADVSVGALYQYLPDRDTIVAALSAAYHAQHEAALDELLSRADASIGAIVTTLAELYHRNAATREARARLQGADTPAAVRAHKLRMVGKVHAHLVASGAVSADAPDTVARTVFFAADGVMHEAFADDETGDPEILAQLEALLRAYLDAER